MADDTNTTYRQGRSEGAGRGNRQGGGRDSGGFRIRLSDNEMQAARALQEAFQLRSTVAVLGFALRALAQLLAEGKLDELVAQQRSQPGGRPPGPRSERGERGERGGDRDRGGNPRAARVDPFARPARPAPAAAEDHAEVPEAADADAAASLEAGELVETPADDLPVATAVPSESDGSEAAGQDDGAADSATPAA